MLPDLLVVARLLGEEMEVYQKSYLLIDGKAMIPCEETCHVNAITHQTVNLN
ncbi:MAG: hypothetical protein JWN14_1924 [Chthonomonadales bacterium]|nr:hypothetical protein [Chthonomonadales bacterium]